MTLILESEKKNVTGGLKIGIEANQAKHQKRSRFALWWSWWRCLMLETKDDLRIDDVVVALQQDKVKSAAVLLRQLLMQPGSSKNNNSRVAQLADKVAAACLQHDEDQDAAAIYRLLLCEDCGLYALAGDEPVVTRTKLLHVLARLGQVTPVSVNTN